MTPNIENKMELQINSMGTRMEKMQLKFNKDLEEKKKKESINIAVLIDCNNWDQKKLERAKGRITEAEDRISEVEDKG